MPNARKHMGKLPCSGLIDIKKDICADDILGKTLAHTRNGLKSSFLVQQRPEMSAMPEAQTSSDLNKTRSTQTGHPNSLCQGHHHSPRQTQPLGCSRKREKLITCQENCPVREGTRDTPQHSGLIDIKEDICADDILGKALAHTQNRLKSSSLV